GAGSAINLIGDNGQTYFQVGRGGTATLDINNGGSLNVTDTGPNFDPSNIAASPSIIIGGSGSNYAPTNGTGIVNANNGHILLEGGNTSLILGHGGGNGTMNLSNGSTVTIKDHSTVGVGDAFVGVGLRMRVGSPSIPSGVLTIDNSTMTVTSDNNVSGIQVAREDIGTTGRLTITGSSARVDINAPSNEAYMNVGRNSGTSGEAYIKDGAQLNLTGDTAYFNVARNLGSTGKMEVTNGGKVTLTGANGSYLRVGYGRNDDGDPNTPREGGTGTLLVSGAGSNVTTGNQIIVGAPLSIGGTNANTSGTLTVTNGGSVTTGDGVYIGFGGTLNGNAIINGNLVNDGGVVAPGNSPGTMTIHGDYTQTSGSILQMEINGFNPGDYDVLAVDGNSIFDSGSIIEMIFADGFLADLLSGAASLASVDLDNMFLFGGSSNLSAALIMATAAGYQSINLTFDASGALASLSASPVPIPAMLPLFAFSLLGLG
ncbi:MAG: hypothetical protein GY943_20910, partial [Chloroflexi bacterium]|nr:hypothetical protein [Chloroflexota bacterium]